MESTPQHGQRLTTLWEGKDPDINSEDFLTARGPSNEGDNIYNIDNITSPLNSLVADRRVVKNWEQPSSRGGTSMSMNRSFNGAGVLAWDNNILNKSVNAHVTFDTFQPFSQTNVNNNVDYTHSLLQTWVPKGDPFVEASARVGEGRQWTLPAGEGRQWTLLPSRLPEPEPPAPANVQKQQQQHFFFDQQQGDTTTISPFLDYNKTSEQISLGWGVFQKVKLYLLITQIQ